MSIHNSLRHVLQSSLVAVFLAFPIIGWAGPVSDRPLFIDAAVDHNLMFVVDDSGSMDWEIIAPAVGEKKAINSYYLFNPGSNSTYTDGDRLYGNWYEFSREYYYLRSNTYNYQYYDPNEKYNPWPSGKTNLFKSADITDAKMDPGFGNASEKYDLTEIGDLDLGNYDAIPATFFMVNKSATVYQITGGSFGSCSSEGASQSKKYDGRCYKDASDGDFYYFDRPINVTSKKQLFVCGSQSSSQNQYSDWYSIDWSVSSKYYYFEDAKGNEIPARNMGFSPDGDCIQRIELADDAKGINKKAVYSALSGTGDSDKFFASQQQNFANWFEYYRRRHQVIRGAVAESVKDLDNMRLGIFWINDNNPSVTMFDSDTNRDEFLDDNYARFVDGTYKGRGTPNRQALNRAGKLYAKKSVRGTLECRQNFTLLFTDGFSSDPGSNWNFGNADKDASAPFGNSKYSGTLGDIAYDYYQNLKDNSGNAITGGAMRVPPECGTGVEESWMDCNTEFHMNTYTIALGIDGAKFAGHGYSKVRDAHDAPPNWGNSNMNSYESKSQIDDLYHAAVNGKGEYYNAKSTTDLVNALKSAVNDVQAQLGSGSNVSFNTTSLKNGGYIYSAQFVSQTWTGTLRAEAIDKDGVVSSRKWDAADKLNSRDLSTDPRLVLTNNGGGVDFKWSELSAAQKNDLKAGGNEALGKARMAYVRNQLIKNAEGVTFRDSKSRLGAIVNSSPVYVGEPNRVWPDNNMFGTKPYSGFKSDQKSRTKAVYVGANDGMLHGFDAETGEEILGYIPGFLYSTDSDKGLSALSDPNLDYQSYVDLPLNTSDVFVDGEWRSIVIGGSRGAEPGIFALDVTDPSKFSATNAGSTVMWEFSGNSNLGHLTEAVQIALLDWGTGDYRWSAVFSNGYGAPSGKNGLFVVDIENPSTYEFIELAAGAGLSPVRLADYMDVIGKPNSDGVTDRAYAGDLEGRLWAINLTGGKSNWGAAFTASAVPSPLYIAKDSKGAAQPITAQPDIARKTYKPDLNDPDLLVFFGTGRYLTASDIPTIVGASQVQTFYGISDHGTSVDSSSTQLSRNDLSERKITSGTVSVAGVSTPVRKTDGAALDWSKNFGWYMDFPKDERVVTGATVSGKYVVFPSIIPSGGDPCGGGGSSYLTALQLDGSTDATKAIIDVNNDGKLGSDDTGWAGVFYGDGIINNIAQIDNILIASDSEANKKPFLTDFGAGQNQTKRIGWHEIVTQ